MSETTSKPEAKDQEEKMANEATAVENNADDWGAALAEQAKIDAEGEVDWGAAMAEQAEMDEDSDLTKDAPAASSNFPDFNADLEGKQVRDIDFILDIPVQMTVELGRTKLPIKNLLQLAQGSVVELDGLAGEPMDVLINGCLIAQGEVVVVNDKFGIRLTDVITPAERIRKLNR